MRNRELTIEQTRYVNLYRGFLVEFLHSEREASDLSPEKAGERAGLDSKTYRRIENGEFTPTFTTLLLIAQGLHGSAEDFFRKFARYLEGRAEKESRCLQGRYYSKDKSECVEIWRIKRGE
jgi:transcriptional regulator with XRE-family HTH domain